MLGRQSIFSRVSIGIFLLCIFLQFSMAAAAFQQGGGKELEHIETRIEQLLASALENRHKSAEKTIELCNTAMGLLKSLDNKELEVRILNEMFWGYYDLGKHPEALQVAKKSIRISERIKYWHGLAMANKHVGTVSQKMYKYSDAVDHLNKAVEMFKQARDKAGVADSLNNLGIVHDDLKNYDMTLEYYFQALKYYEEVDDREGMAGTYINAGTVYIKLGKFNEATEYYEKALDIYKELNNRRGMANSLSNMGSIYSFKGERGKAIETYKKALDIFRTIQYKWGVALILSNIGQLYMNMKKYDEATAYITESMELAEKIGYKRGLANCYKNLALLSQATGKPRTAIRYAEKELALALEINSIIHISAAYDLLSLFYSQRKDFKTALKYHREFKEVNDKSYEETDRRKIGEMQVKYRTEKKEKEIQLLKRDNSIQQLELGKQRNIRDLLLVILILILVLALVLYNRYQVKAKGTRELQKEIEEHKQTHKRLRESEKKFRTLAEKSLVGIYILQDDRLMYVNPQMNRLFGYTSPGLQESRSILDLVHPEDREGVVENLGVLTSGREESLQYQLRGMKENGEVIYLESYDSCIYFDEKPAILGTIIDVTERKKAEEEILKSRKLESVGILAGGIAHDFNNLLTIMSGSLNLLKLKFKRRKKDEAAANAFENLEKTASQAADLAQRLITFSNSGWLMREKLNLPHLLETAIEYLPALKEQYFDISIPSNLQPLYADERQFRQVLQNVLLNAVEADPHGRTIQIEAKNLNSKRPPELDKTGRYIDIAVRDRGVGIPSDILGKIFDPYFSTKAGYSQKGLGLGLTICYSIIKKHDGHITFSSNPGEGTEVHLYVPAFTGEEKPDFSFSLFS